MHKSRTGSNFGQIGPLTVELAALERQNIFNRIIIGKWCLHASLNHDNQDRHKSWVEFDFGSNQTTHFGVSCP